MQSEAHGVLQEQGAGHLVRLSGEGRLPSGRSISEAQRMIRIQPGEVVGGGERTLVFMKACRLRVW